MNKYSIALKITNWCNANCAHCCDSCGPEPMDLMLVEDMDKYLSAFKKMNVNKWDSLVFSGGETMAPYIIGNNEYVPQCMEIAFKNGFAPFFKTNGLWGKSDAMRNRILTDFAKTALKHKKLTSMDISVDEFHDNLDPVANIIMETAKSPVFSYAVRLSLVGLDTPKSLDNFRILKQTLSARGLKMFEKDETLFVESPVAFYPVFYNFNTPVFKMGRAKENNIGCDIVLDGAPDPDVGNCLRIDNRGELLLNDGFKCSVNPDSFTSSAERLINQMRKSLRLNNKIK